MKNIEVVKQVKERAQAAKESLSQLKNETDPAVKQQLQRDLKETNERMREDLTTAQLAILANKIDSKMAKPARYEMLA